VIRQARIIVHLGDLERPERNFANFEVAVGFDTLWLEDRRGNSLHAGNGSRRSVDRAQVDGLSEFEVARCEERGLAVGQDPAAQDLAQLLLNVTLEVVGIDANRKLYFERDVVRSLDFEVLSRQAIAVDVTGERPAQ
jgi:hypothetical protein